MLKLFFQHVVFVLTLLMYVSTTEAAVTPFSVIDVSVRIDGVNSIIQVPCEGIKYTGADGRTGCNNAKYSYLTFSTPTWESGEELQCKAYWDWIYEAYTGGSLPVFSSNCHGLAFDVGDWPTLSGRLITAGGVNCWVMDSSNATIASNFDHSIKITVEDCPLSVGLRILEIYEKFRESAIYTRTAACSDEYPLYLGEGNGERYGMQFSEYRLNL